jgi:hypothetical protein
MKPRSLSDDISRSPLKKPYCSCLDPGVHESCEYGRRHQELAPLCIPGYGRVVNKRVVDHICFCEVDRDIAVRMRRRVTVEKELCVIEVQRVVFGEDLDGKSGDWAAGNVKLQPSTRVATARCSRVFSWAVILAPAWCSHSFPSVWSKCQ